MKQITSTSIISFIEKGFKALKLCVFALIISIVTAIASALLVAFPYVAFTKIDSTFGWIHIIASVILFGIIYYWDVTEEADDLLTGYVISCVITFILNMFIFILFTWFAYEYGIWIGLGVLIFFIIPLLFHDS